MNTLLLDESSVLRGLNSLLGLFVMCLLTVLVLAAVFLMKWVLVRGQSAPGTNRRLFVVVLAFMAFIYFVICVTVKDMEWGAVLDALLPG